MGEEEEEEEEGEGGIFLREAILQTSIITKNVQLCSNEIFLNYLREIFVIYGQTYEMS